MGSIDWSWLIPITIIVGMVYLVREVLVLAGLLKSPVLRRFEKYGDAEQFYYPYPNLLAGAGIVAIGVGHLVAPALRIWFLPMGPTVMLWTFAYFIYYHRGFAERYPHLFQQFPFWYRDLREYTTRLERRRIAYMWLDLPPRTRLLYNSSDRAFMHWADMIVMSTVH